MATREELSANAREELRFIQQTWTGLFNGHDDRRNLAQMIEDTHHSPPALQHFVQAALEASTDLVRNDFNEYFKDGVPDNSDEPLQFIVSGLMCYAETIAIRMFRMGQEVRERYPWDKLTPCSCKTLADDEVDEFLQASSELRFLHEGGVIPEPDENGGKT